MKAIGALLITALCCQGALVLQKPLIQPGGTRITPKPVMSKRVMPNPVMPARRSVKPASKDLQQRVVANVMSGENYYNEAALQKPVMFQGPCNGQIINAVYRQVFSSSSELVDFRRVGRDCMTAIEYFCRQLVKQGQREKPRLLVVSDSFAYVGLQRKAPKCAELVLEVDAESEASVISAEDILREYEIASLHLYARSVEMLPPVDVSALEELFKLRRPVVEKVGAVRIPVINKLLTIRSAIEDAKRISEFKVHPVLFDLFADTILAKDVESLHLDARDAFNYPKDWMQRLSEFLDKSPKTKHIAIDLYNIKDQIDELAKLKSVESIGLTISGVQSLARLGQSTINGKISELTFFAGQGADAERVSMLLHSFDALKSVRLQISDGFLEPWITVLQQIEPHVRLHQVSLRKFELLNPDIAEAESALESLQRVVENRIDQLDSVQFTWKEGAALELISLTDKTLGPLFNSINERDCHT